MQRIGLFGGSFNPPTLGHLAIAREAVEALGLDKILWIISPHNPMKDIKTLAPFNHRIAMVEILIANQPKMEASAIEQEQGSSLTIDTVRNLRKKNPEDILIFMMGADNWHHLHQWDDYREMLDHVSLAALRRPKYDDLETAFVTKEFAPLRVETSALIKPYNSFIFINNNIYDTSATEVRKALSEGKEPPYLHPDILAYIKMNNLYCVS